MNTVIEIETELDELNIAIETKVNEKEDLRMELDEIANIDHYFTKYELYILFKQHLERIYGPIKVCGVEYSHIFVLRSIETEKYNFMFEEFKNNFDFSKTDNYLNKKSEISEKIHYIEGEINELKILEDELNRKLKPLRNEY